MEIRLYPDHSTELYKQLADQLLILIAKGAFKEGERLPSVRQLATQLKVNPNTVQKAYQLLHETGLILVEPKKRAVVSRQFSNEENEEYIKKQLLNVIYEAEL